MANNKNIWFVIYLVFALYFVNSALNFLAMPQIIQDIDRWITLVGGVLILVGGFNLLRASRYRHY